MEGGALMSKRTTKFEEMPNTFMDYMGKKPRVKLKRRRHTTKKRKINLNKPQGF